jgi:hypothetical protein
MDSKVCHLRNAGVNTSRPVRVYVCGLLVVVLSATSGCGTARHTGFRDTTRGIAFRYPAGWFVTGFSKTNFPSRLVAASYPVTRLQVEGDCGGMDALNKLPSGGAAVLIIDYARAAATSSFPARPQRFRLRDGKYGNYECFGQSYLFHFNSAGRDLQAHVVIGHLATARRRDEALAILDSLARSS